MLVGPLRAADLRAADRHRALARLVGVPGADGRARACWPRCGGSCRWRCSSRYGIDFLQFTEQPRSIWGTEQRPGGAAADGLLDLVHRRRASTASTAPLFSEAGTLLFNPLVVGASLLLPALAIGGFVWTRRWRYAPVPAARAAGRRGDRGGRRSRAARPAARRWSGSTATSRSCASCAPRRRRRRWSRSGWRGCSAWARRSRGRAAALPRLRRGRALVGSVAGGADRARRAAARARHGDREAADLEAHPGRLDRRRPRPRPGPAAATRARWCCPGQIFANYTWGGTTDAILPRVTKRPVAVRYETPYGDPRSTDLLWTVDRLVAAGPAAARPAAAAAAADGRGRGRHGQRRRHRRSGAVERRAAAAELAGQGLEPAHAHLRARRAAIAPARGELGRAARAARGAPLRRRRRARHRARGRLGAAHDRGRRRRGAGGPGRLRRAADRAPDPLRRRPRRRRSCAARPRAGAEVVVTRLQPPPPLRAGVRAARTSGATLPAKEPLDPNHAIIDPFPERGTRRPDGRGAARAPATCARPTPAGCSSSPSTTRSRPSTATRARSGPPTATTTRAAAGSRSGSTGRATCPTSSCCRCATRAAR